MKITPIQTPLIEIGQSLATVLRSALPRPLQERDVLCVTSKVISVSQGRLVDLSTVQPSSQAMAMRKPHPSADPHDSAELIELMLREADQIFGLDDVWLTVKDGILVANAGIDLSNVPPGHAVLWPDRPWDWARSFREALRQEYGLGELGIVITDSRSVPLRRGVIGIAMAFSGFEGVESQKGKADLYGRPLAFTEKAVADDLASIAILVAGEAGERIPFVLIEGAPVVFTERPVGPQDVLLDPHIDFFSSIYNEDFKSIMSSAKDP